MEHTDEGWGDENLRTMTVRLEFTNEEVGKIYAALMTMSCCSPQFASVAEPILQKLKDAMNAAVKELVQAETAKGPTQ